MLTMEKIAFVTVSFTSPKSINKEQPSSLTSILVFKTTGLSKMQIRLRTKLVVQSFSKTLMFSQARISNASVMRINSTLMRMVFNMSKNTGEVLLPRKPPRRLKPKLKLRPRQPD